MTNRWQGRSSKSSRGTPAFALSPSISQCLSSGAQTNVKFPVESGQISQIFRSEVMILIWKEGNFLDLDYITLCNGGSEF